LVLLTILIGKKTNNLTGSTKRYLDNSVTYNPMESRQSRSRHSYQKEREEKKNVRGTSNCPALDTAYALHLEQKVGGCGDTHTSLIRLGKDP